MMTTKHGKGVYSVTPRSTVQVNPLRAQIQRYGVLAHLGVFPSAREARAARKGADQMLKALIRDGLLPQWSHGGVRNPIA